MQAEPNPVTHSFSDILEQGNKGTFVELPTSKLRRLADDYETEYGGPPRDYEEPTNLQLSALAARLALEYVP